MLNCGSTKTSSCGIGSCDSILGFLGILFRACFLVFKGAAKSTGAAKSKRNKHAVPCRMVKWRCDLDSCDLLYHFWNSLNSINLLAWSLFVRHFSPFRRNLGQHQLTCLLCVWSTLNLGPFLKFPMSEIELVYLWFSPRNQNSKIVWNFTTAHVFEIDPWRGTSKCFVWWEVLTHADHFSPFHRNIGVEIELIFLDFLLNTKELKFQNLLDFFSGKCSWRGTFKSIAIV